MRDWDDLPANAQTVAVVESCIDCLTKNNPYPPNMKIDRTAFAGARAVWMLAICRLEEFMAKLTTEIEQDANSAENPSSTLPDLLADADVESTGFDAENTARALNTPIDVEQDVNSAENPPPSPTEIEAFVVARDKAKEAEYRIDVLTADLERHLLSLIQNIRIRTAKDQATLSLADLEGTIGELLVARDVLLVVLGRSDPQEDDA